MRILVTRSENNLTELARRLFKIEGPNAAADERTAVSALHLANPHLDLHANLPEGAPFVVPDVEGLNPVAAPAQPVTNLNESVKELRTTFSRVADTLEQSFQEAREALDAEAKQLKQHARELKAADNRVAQRLAAIDKAAKQRSKELTEKRKLHQQAIDQLAKELDSLLKAFR